MTRRGGEDEPNFARVGVVKGEDLELSTEEVGGHLDAWRKAAVIDEDLYRDG